MTLYITASKRFFTAPTKRSLRVSPKAASLSGAEAVVGPVYRGGGGTRWTLRSTQAVRPRAASSESPRVPLRRNRMCPPELPFLLTREGGIRGQLQDDVQPEVRELALHFGLELVRALGAGQRLII